MNNIKFQVLILNLAYGREQSWALMVGRYTTAVFFLILISSCETNAIHDVSKEGVNEVAFITASDGGLPGLVPWSAKITILGVDGKKIEEANSVEVSPGPHVVEVACIWVHDLFSFSPRKIKKTFIYEVEAKPGHTYQIRAELTAGHCDAWIEDIGP